MAAFTRTHDDSILSKTHLEGKSKAFQSEPDKTEYLTDYSDKDKPWDIHKCQSGDVSDIYETDQYFVKYSQRMKCCAGCLRFAWVVDKETGEAKFKLRGATFCRVRHCPICQWRRAKMWQARFLKSLPAIEAAHLSAGWLFLTLTVKNCPIDELGETLNQMNEAWNRLRLRKEFGSVLGWIRTTEVTRGKDGSAHPHFHALLMVKPSMLAGVNYVTQARWTELWQGCGKLDYKPIVDIRTVKSKAPKDKEPQTISEKLRGAIAETLKYAVKPSDMVADPDWFLEMTRQVHKKRFIASGGVLKDILKLTEEKNEDLLVSDDSEAEGIDDGKRIGFEWAEFKRKYKRAQKLDV